MKNLPWEKPDIEVLIDSGELTHASTRADVVELVGEPDSVGGKSRKYKIPRVYKYGEIQIVFGTQKQDTVQYVYIDDCFEPIYLLAPETGVLKEDHHGPRRPRA